MLGRNGVGKTTLIDSLVGVTRRFAGSITLGRPRGRRAGARSARRARHRLGAAGAQHLPLAHACRRTSPPWRGPDRGRWSACSGSSRGSRSAGSSPAARCRAASSRCWRSAARWRPIRGCCCSTSRPRGWRRSSCRSCWPRCARLLREEGLAAIIVEQHAQKILPITDRALILERGRVVHRERQRRAAGRFRPARALSGSHRAVTPIFESFATFEKSFTGRRRYPNIRATALIHKQRAGLEETMIDRMGAWPRRRVLAGMVGAARGAGRARDPARGALGHAGARWAAHCR